MKTVFFKSLILVFRVAQTPDMFINIDMHTYKHTYLYVRLCYILSTNNISNNIRYVVHKENYASDYYICFSTIFDYIHA